MKLNMLSAISNKGKLCFTITKESVNADILIDFMRRLVKDSDRKVLLILDNLRVHHSKKVTAWLKKHKEEIEVFFLPPYAPEYNPDEYLHGDMKRAMGKADAEIGKRYPKGCALIPENPATSSGESAVLFPNDVYEVRYGKVQYLIGRLIKPSLAR